MSGENGSASAIVRAEHESYEGLRMVVSPAEATRRLQELQAFVQQSMVRDVDYGVIPGTGDKSTLYQPGAQKLAEIYGFSHRFEPVEVVKDWDRGFFYFEYRCLLVSRRNGQMVGEGIGSCNSRESKYAGRWVAASDVPPGMNKESLQKRTGARWVFASEVPAGVDKRSLPTQERRSKKGGTYTVYKLVDEQYLVPNPDPYSLVNTMQKMAAKRAYIHAVIAATRSSGILTQDVEDLPPEVFGEAEEARSWEREEEPDDPPTPEPPRAKKVADRVRANAAKGAAKGARAQALEAAMADASTLEELKAAWRAVANDVKSGALTAEEATVLAAKKEAAKERIAAAAPPAQPDADPEPPEGAPEGEREPGEEG